MIYPPDLHINSIFSGFTLGYPPFLNNPDYIDSCVCLYILSYKAVSKIWIQGHMPENFKMIPGILPFSYFVYENHNSESTISFKLSKKSIFSSKTVQIIESEK